MYIDDYRKSQKTAEKFLGTKGRGLSSSPDMEEQVIRNEIASALKGEIKSIIKSLTPLEKKETRSWISRFDKSKNFAVPTSKLVKERVRLSLGFSKIRENLQNKK